MKAPGRVFPVLELWGPENDVELALAFLFDRGSTGAEEDLATGRRRVYFPSSFALTNLIDEVSIAFPFVSCHSLPPLPDRDWLSEWKASFSGIALGESFYVHPTWQASPDTARQILRIDPEQAFGTGLHDTTRLSLELLERWLVPGMDVVDIGTGTGILAMVAAKLGARAVVALEPDPEAAGCARRNVERNGLGGVVTVASSGFEAFERLRGDLLVANVDATALSRALPRLDGDVLILSGILLEEVEELTARLEAPYSLAETWSAGEWGALCVTR